MTGERSREARERAERVLGLLAEALGPDMSRVVVIGGLIPELLVHAVVEHRGTSDVDIVVPLAATVFDRDDDDFGWLERGLRTAGFVADPTGLGWRWIADVGGDAVVVELLADVNDAVGQAIVIPGTTLSAMNLHGPRSALAQNRIVRIGAHDVRVASRGAFLFSKAAAFLGRGLAKDLYDFAFVLVEAAREDVRAVADEVIVALPDAVDYDPAGVIRDMCAQFGDAGRGLIVYAEEMLRAGSDEDVETLRLDALAAIAAFGAVLRASDERFG